MAITVGLNVMDAGNLTNELVQVRHFTDFIKQHVVRMGDIDPSISTLKDWLALPKKERDKRKVRVKYVTPGTIPAGHRRANENVVSVGLTVLDIDSNNFSPFDVEQMFDGVESRFYQTANSQQGDRRWRVIIPHWPHLPPAVYTAKIKAFLAAKRLPADSCSATPAQGHMLPIAFDDYAPAIHETHGAILDLSSYGPTNVVPMSSSSSFEDVFGGTTSHAEEAGADVDDVDADAEALVKFAPKIDGVSRDMVEDVLEDFDPDVSYHDGWWRMGAALHHQFDGSEEGYRLFRDWSAKAPDRFDEAGVRRTWETYRHRPPSRPVTLASVMGRQLRSFQQTELRRSFLTDIDRCSDEDRLRHQIPREIAGTDGLSPEDRDLLAKALSRRVGQLMKATFGVYLPAKQTVLRKIMDPSTRPTGHVRTESGKQALESSGDWLEGWVYVQNGDQFHNIETKRKATPQGFDREFNRVLRRQGITDMSASAYASWGPTPIPVVTDAVYMPGAEPMFAINGVHYLNTWDTTSVPDALDPLCWGEDYRRYAALVSRFFRIMFPNHRERRIVMAWLTFVAQNPGKRVNWSLVIQGPHGIGKTLLGDLMRCVLGRQNVGNVEPHVMSSNFTGWATGHVLKIVEEIRLPGEKGTAHAIVNSIKPYITNDIVSIHRKNKEAIDLPNVSNYLQLTNHRDAIPIEHGERRYCVLFTGPESAQDVEAITRRWPSLYKDLYRLMQNHPEIVAGLFTAWSPTDWWPEFNPKGHAPMTPARERMAEYTMPDDELVVKGLLEQNSVGVNVVAGVISGAHFRRLASDEHGYDIKTRRVGYLLAQEGYHRQTPSAGASRGRLSWGGSQTTIYTRHSNIDTLQILAALDETAHESLMQTFGAGRGDDDDVG